MSKFNKSQIMKRAWELYNTPEYEFVRHQIAKQFLPERFRNCLRTAWAEAKRDATPLADRIATIHNEIDMTKYLPLGINQAQRVKVLQTELAVLQEAA